MSNDKNGDEISNKNNPPSVGIVSPVDTSVRHGIYDLNSNNS